MRIKILYCEVYLPLHEYCQLCGYKTLRLPFNQSEVRLKGNDIVESKYIYYRFQNITSPYLCNDYHWLYNIICKIQKIEKSFFTIVVEASYFDPINMTKNWLEYDRKKFTPTNMNFGTWPKNYINEHEWLNMIKIPMKMTEILKCLKFIRTMNLNGWIWPK